MPRYIYPVAFLSVSFGDKGKFTVSFSVETDKDFWFAYRGLYMRFDGGGHQNY